MFTCLRFFLYSRYSRAYAQWSLFCPTCVSANDHRALNDSTYCINMRYDTDIPRAGIDGSRRILLGCGIAST